MLDKSNGKWRGKYHNLLKLFHFFAVYYFFVLVNNEQSRFSFNLKLANQIRNGCEKK